MLVYLADLRHRTITMTPDAMPLGIGFLASFGSKALGGDVRFKLFAYAEHLEEELRQARPDVLGITNYCWNYALSCRMLRFARGLYADLLTVMGGPNMALDHEGEERVLRQTPCLDAYVINEGEEAFASAIGRYIDAGMDKGRLFQEPLSSSIFVDPDGSDVVRGHPTARMKTLDEIPSPYLTGLMDQFFDGAFCPMVQTNRGCPFTCTFCVEGVGYMTKVHKFAGDRVREELDYIGGQVGIGSALMISDSNFGMLPGDLETAKAVRELQERNGWPKFVWATTGKNKKESILSAVDLLDGTMRMTNSVQSLDESVLTNIKRSNIKLETYSALQEEVQARGLQSYAEVIIGLPGETLETFVRGVCQLLDSGVHQLACYQLMLLDGTELNSQTTRERYGFKTKFRMISRNLGVYAGEPVFELEEIVASTSTLSYDDYMKCRKLQLVLEVYHREGLFRELLEYLKTHSVAISTFMLDLLDHLGEAPEEVGVLFANYMKESEEELFESPEDARRALAATYDSLVEEDKGGNLIQKYSALAWFRTLDSVVEYGVRRARSLVLEERTRERDGAGSLDNELEAIRRYLLAVTINIVDLSNQLEDVVMSLDYDIEAWKAQGYQQPLSDFAQSQSGASGEAAVYRKAYVFYISQADATYLRAKLRMHGTSAQAVGKLLSRVVLRDLRRQVRVQPEHTRAAIS